VKRTLSRLTPAVLLLMFSVPVLGQESVVLPTGLIGIRPTPLRLSASFGLPTAIRAAASPAPIQYGYGNPDMQLGRAWLGSLIGLASAYAGDLLIHYEGDFSRGNMFLNEDNGSGEVVFNVLLYGGLAPMFSLSGLRVVNPWYGNRTGGYLGGVLGSLAGLAYWTKLNDVTSAQGILVTSGLMALGTVLGYNIFR
jgi:hypothetical protein